MCYSLYFYSPGYHRDRHSFPTRRSSDLECADLGQHLGLLVADEVALEARRLRELGRALQLAPVAAGARSELQDRKSTRLNSSHVAISYAVFCLKKKKKP